MKKLYSIIIIMGLLIVAGCEPRYPYPEAFFPENPVNFRELNTQFDDMNSDLREAKYGMFNFTFSSNSKSLGQNFSFVESSVNFSWRMKLGTFTISVDGPNIRGEDVIHENLDLINTDCNQKGPYSFQTKKTETVFLYSSDCGGADKIKILILSKEAEIIEKAASENLNFNLFPEEHVREMYPSFYGKNLPEKYKLSETGLAEKLIFASDKDGRFDLYEVDVPSNLTVVEFLKTTKNHQPKKLSISSSYNDHSPFVIGNTMVFASDRPGGYGGYDLYKTTCSNGIWSTPENLGETINSTYDEFRPIIERGESFNGPFKNNMMIYSSNRPGGKGGFDLYYVGVPK